MRTIKLLTLAVLLGTLVSCEDDSDSSVKEENILNLITKTYYLESYYEDTMVFDSSTRDEWRYYYFDRSRGYISLGETLFQKSVGPIQIIDTLRIDLSSFPSHIVKEFKEIDLDGWQFHQPFYASKRINHLEIIGYENHPNLKITAGKFILNDVLKIGTSNIPIDKLNEMNGKNWDTFKQVDMTKDQRSFEITFNADISTNTEEGVYKRPFGATYEDFFFSSVGDIGLISKSEREGGLTYSRDFKYQVKEIYY